MLYVPCASIHCLYSIYYTYVELCDSAGSEKAFIARLGHGPFPQHSGIGSGSLNRWMRWSHGLWGLLSVVCAGGQVHVFVRVVAVLSFDRFSSTAQTVQRQLCDRWFSTYLR